MSSEGNPEINISEDRGQQDDDNSSVESNNEFKVPLPAKDKREIEQEQEAKLKAKYGMMKKPGGGSALLQKRLQKGKYFDSGDYNMAKAKMNNPKHPLAAKEKLLLQESIGGVIPTPESVEQTRKPSITTSKLLMAEEGGEKLDFHQRRGGVHNM